MAKKIEPTALAAVVSGNGRGNGHLSYDLNETSTPISKPKKSRKSREQREREAEGHWSRRGDLIGL